MTITAKAAWIAVEKQATEDLEMIESSCEQRPRRSSAAMKREGDDDDDDEDEQEGQVLGKLRACVRRVTGCLAEHTHAHTRTLARPTLT